MAESIDTQSRDWNSLPDVFLEQICNRMDLLSTVRLAACCVFVPSTRLQPAGSFQDTLLADAQSLQVAVVPLDMLPLPVHLSFMCGHYWAGMKANWIVIIHQSGSPWRLVDIYTQREITLPSLDTSAIEPRGPPDTPAYYTRDALSF